MVQKPRMTRQKKNNKGLIVGGSTVAVLAIVGGILWTAIDNEDNNAAVNEPDAAVVVNQHKSDNENNNTHDEQNDAAAQEPAQTAADQEPSSEEPTSSTAPTEQTADLATNIDATKYIEGQPAATEPTYINGVLLANKQYPLPQSYNPGVDPTAQKAMDELVAAAKTAGFSLTAFSGFRSYEYQTTLYTNYVARDGQDEADRYSARPGYSEHQTGLAFDVGEVGKEDLWLTEAFGETEAGKWLVAHAHEHGFILRYPKGKEHLTGFMYESWHFRYVGKDIAAAIYKQDVTLEEYLGVYNNAANATTSDATEQSPAQQSEEKPQVGAKTNNND